MDPSTTQAQIRELESVRKQINFWRIGTTVVIVATMATCLGLLYTDARNLVMQGPTQKVFVDNLQAGVNENIVPRIKEVTSRTLTEMQPVVQKEFVALNTRVPDVTKASLDQVQQLQTTLPDRVGKSLNGTFSKAFSDKEAEIKKMFPDATEDQVKALFTNITSMTQTRSQAVAQELLSAHIGEIHAIQKNLDDIAATEKTKPGDSTDDWGMGLAVFDVLREDLKGLSLPKGEAGAKIVEAAGTVADAAKHVADTANQVSKTTDGAGDLPGAAKHVADTANQVSKAAKDIAGKAKEEGKN